MSVRNWYGSLKTLIERYGLLKHMKEEEDSVDQGLAKGFDATATKSYLKRREQWATKREPKLRTD